MILLDTDHFSVLVQPHSSRAAPLIARLEASPDQGIGVTIVTVEEAFRGWMSELNRLRDARDQISAYDRLALLVEFLASWQIVRFDLPAADAFHRLKGERIRIGTQDLKIAAMALAQEALLLSANLRDFEQVPGLRVENWLD